MMTMILRRTVWTLWLLLLVPRKSIWAQRDAAAVKNDHDHDDLLPPAECQPFTRRYDPLACWLSGLKLSLPDQSFQSGFIKLEIKGLECSRFAIEGLTSNAPTVATKSDVDEILFHLTVRNISASCVASYHSVGLGGDLHIQVGGCRDPDTSTSALDWTLAIKNDNRTKTVPRPDSVDTQQCQSELDVVDLQFTGSTSAKFIDLFRHRIARYISDELNDLMCPNLVATVDPLLTKYIRRMNTYMEPYTHEEYAIRLGATKKSAMPKQRRLSPSLHNENTTLSLESQAPVLVRALTILNDYTTFYLRSGLLQHLFPHTYHGDLDCGWIFSGINGLIRDMLRRSGGQLEVPIPHRYRSLPTINILGSARIELTVESLILSGLDEWSRILLLQPADAGFVTRLTTSHELTASIGVSANISSSGAILEDYDLQERFDLHVNVSSLDAWLSMAMDLEASAWRKLTIGQVIDLVDRLVKGDDSIQVDCIRRAIAALQAKDLGINVLLSGIVLEPALPQSSETFDGRREQDVDAVLNNLLMLALREYPSYISRALHGLSHGPTRHALNKWMEEITMPDGSCTGPHSQGEHRRLANFSNFLPLTSLNNLLQKPYTLEQLNSFFDCAAHFLSRAVVDSVSSSAGGVPFLDDLFMFQLKRFDIENAGSVRGLRLLAPTANGTGLSSSLDFGVALAPLATVQPRLFISGNVDSAPMDLLLSFEAIVGFDNLGGAVACKIQYDLAELDQMSVADALQHGQCLALPAVSTIFEQVQGSLLNMNVLVNATASTGRESLFAMRFDSRDYPIIAESAASVVDWMLKSSHDLAKSVSLHFSKLARSQCNGLEEIQGDDYDTQNVNVYGILMTIVAFVVLAQAALLLVPRNMSTRRSDEPYAQNTTTYSSDDELSQPLLVDEPAEDVLNIRGPQSYSATALKDADCLTFVVRLLIPVVIIGTMMVLLSSNLSVGATVDLYAVLNDRHVSVPSIFSFSLINTAHDMLQARIYPLFLLIVGFSGIWPYTKLFMLLYAWMAPPSRLLPSRRGRYLLALDALGKFSLVDAYVLILFVVAFRFHLSLADDTALDVFVTPQFGFYGFLIATNASLVIGHLLVFCHRQSELQHIDQDDKVAESVVTHLFRVDDTLRKMSATFASLLLASTLLAFALVAFGATQKCFVFEVGGLAGYAIGVDRRSVYSLVSLGTSLRSAVRDSNSLSITFLQAVYFFYTIITPFACLSLLLFLMFVPLTLKRRLVVLTLAEIANAWSAIEVFALSMIAAVLQVPTFASFMVGDRCRLLDDILENYFESGDATCYSVKASVSKNASILIAGTLLNWLLVSTLLRLIHVAVRETTQRATDGRKDNLAMEEGGCNMVQRLAEYLPWTFADPGDASHHTP